MVHRVDTMRYNRVYFDSLGYEIVHDGVAGGAHPAVTLAIHSVNDRPLTAEQEKHRQEKLKREAQPAPTDKQ